MNLPCTVCNQEIVDNDTLYTIASCMEQLDNNMYTVVSSEGLLSMCKSCVDNYEPWRQIEKSFKDHFVFSHRQPGDELVLHGEKTHYNCCLCKESVPDGNPIFTLTHSLETMHKHHCSVHEAWFLAVTCKPCHEKFDLNRLSVSLLDNIQFSEPNSST